MSLTVAEMRKKIAEAQKGKPRYYGVKDEEEEMERFGDSLKRYNKEQKALAKLTTEKQRKPTYKQTRGNIQKSRSDLHVNKKTGKREITTDMVIHKGLTAKEKAGLKKSILNAVKKHLSGSGLHIPLSGGYTNSLIFHEMGKYIPPKDRKLMKKLIEASKPPPIPQLHSGAGDEREHHLVEVKPIDSDSDSDFERNDTESENSDYDRYDTESEDEEHMRRIRELNDPDSDSDDDMYGNGFGHVLEHLNESANTTRKGMGFGQFLHAIKQAAVKTKQALDAPKRMKEAVDKRIASEKAKMPSGSGIRRTKLHNHGTPHPVLKRPRGRPRKIVL